jgi:hypothetical protein
VGRQAGAAPPHSPSPAQARQAFVVASHTGAAPPQPAFDRQPTQVAVAASQSGVAPVQRVAFPAEHWPQAPEG